MRQLKMMRVVKGKTVMTTEAAVDTLKIIQIFNSFHLEHLTIRGYWWQGWKRINSVNV